MKLVGLGAVSEAIRIAHKIMEHDKNFELLGFIDNDEKKWNTKLDSFPIFGGLSLVNELIKKEVKFCNFVTHDAISRYETGLELVKRGARLSNFIYPQINLEFVKLGLGNYIQENVVLQAHVQIGNNSSIHIGSLIGHDTKIGNSVFIAHGCNISGGVEIEDGVFLGTGVSVLPNIRIGKWSIIGAGSLIIEDVPPYSLVVGNPGKVIKTFEKKYNSGNVF